MNISAVAVSQIGAKSVQFEGNLLRIGLTDGRAIVLPFEQVSWLRWLTKATPEQRANWSIEPGGYAVYWEDLDDGFEVDHVLSLIPVNGDLVALSDEELTLNAELSFLELDAQETEDAYA